MDQTKVSTGDVISRDRLDSFFIESGQGEAFTRITEILQPHAEQLATIYLENFFAAANVQVDEAMMADQIAKSTAYTRGKYSPPIDDAWIARVEKIGRLQYKLGVPQHAHLGALNRSHRLAVELIFAGARDVAEAHRLVDQFFRVSGLEAEVMMSTINTLKDAAHNEQVQASADNFQSTISQIVSAASEESGKARDRAKSVDEATKSLLALLSEVAAGSVQSSSAMEEAARMSGDLASTIGHIDDELSSAFQSFAELSKTAEQSVASSERLADHEKSIERVVKLIRDIADQTSILALNALIEAASAGEAGAGFSIVASEMKSLASQTEKATEEIREELAGIGEASRSSIDANNSMHDRFASLQKTAGNLRSSMA